MTKRPTLLRQLALSACAAVLLASCSLGGDEPGGPSSADGSAGATGAPAEPGPGQIGGIVRSESGEPVFGARVELEDSAAVSDGSGRFVLPRPDADGVLVVTTDATYGYVPIDAQSEEQVEVTVHPAPSGARSLRFGGEVRTGRTLLSRSADAAAYADALAGVSPLLSLAEATAVTLASPLVEDPWQSDRDASSGLLASGLSKAGVDAVSLATDRIVDAGPQGVAETRSILDEAGIAAFGAGDDLEAAWAPARLSVGGSDVAYLGCQIGSASARWAAAADRAGAAVCASQRLRRAIASAARDADAVVVFIRDDQPFQAAVSDRFSAMVKDAVRGGATVIIGSGSHMAGEVWDFGNATAVHDLGDLLTDDASWASRDGILLRTDVDGGQATSVSAEPLTRSDGLPSMVRGDLAEEISRIAAGDINDGPLVLADDIAVVSSGTWTIDQTTASAEPDDDGPPLELGDGWWIPPAGQQGVMAGWDLAPTGTFEDIDADPATDGAIGWLLSPDATLVSAGQDGQVCEGARAVRLEPSGKQPATIFTAASIPVPAVEGLSAYAVVRDIGDRRLRGQLRLQWFAGESKIGEDSVELGGPDALCDGVRLDTIPPAGTDSVRPVVAIERGAAVVDDVHVVAWDKGRKGGRRYSRLRVFDPAQVTLVVDVPRGAQAPPGPFREPTIDGAAGG